MASNQSFSTFTEIGMIDARTYNGTVTLPVTSSILGRIVTLKDIYGASSNSTITVQTTGLDRFEDGTSTKLFNTAFESITLYAGQAGSWYTIGGSFLTTANIGAVYVSSLVTSVTLSTQNINLSSINGLTFGGPINSTVIGLATAGYISTSQLTSTTAGITTTITSGGFTSTLSTSYGTSFTSFLVNASSLKASSILASNATFSSIQINVLSSFLMNTGQAYINNLLLGTVSAQTAIKFYGLNGTFNNTVVAEQSTGTDSQELLLFKGSSPADRIRLTTTGSIVFETQVTAQTFSNNAAVGVPTMFIASNLVGIGTSSIGSLLDVGGQARAITVSTQNINLSSINGLTFGGPINSTSIGLATIGYVSTSQLTSTVASIQSGFATTGFLSTLNLLSTVGGLGTTGYLSSLSQVLLVSTLALNVSSINGLTFGGPIVSTVTGLGSAGYVSTGSLVSTTANILYQVNTSGHLSTLNLTSTVQGLGSIGYISSFLFVTQMSTLQLITSSIGVGCNAPAYTLDVQGSIHGTTMSSIALYSSSFIGTLADAQTVVLYEI